MAALFLLIGISASSQQNSWSRYSIFPEGGTILDIASDDNGTIYVMTPFSRIFYSTDNGDNWTIMQGTHGFWNITDIEVNKSSGRLYVGTNTEGIWFTSNLGQTWDWEYFYTSPQGQHAGIVQVGVKHGTGVVVACEPGPTTSTTYVSTNNGASWTHHINNTPFGVVVDYLFLQDGTLLAGTEQGVFQSSNNGATWTSAPANLSALTVTSLSQRNNGKIFAGTNYNRITQNTTGTGVYLSTDSGQSWVYSSTGITDTRISDLYFDEATATLFAATPTGVFASTNNGSSWSSINFNLVDVDVNCVTGKASGEVFIGANQDGVSRLGASAWILKNHGLENTSVSDMLIDGSNAFYIAYEASSGLYKQNVANQWQHLGIGQLPALSSCNRIVNSTNGDLYSGFVSSDIDRGVATSVDNGITWTGLGSAIPVPSGIYYASFMDIEVGPVAGQIYVLARYSGSSITTFYDVFRSLDNGLSWVSVFTANTSNSIFSIGDLDITSTGHIYVTYSDFGGTQVAFSTDQGATFNLMNISVPGFFQDMVVDRQDSVYLVAGNVVYEKNGANWIAKPNGGWPLDYSAHAVSIYFDNANSIYLSCADDGVYYSNTGGQSWQNITQGLPTYIGLSGTYRVHLKKFCFNSANKPFAITENIEINDLSIQGIYTFGTAAPTGMGVDYEESAVTLFPNPAQDYFSIHSGNERIIAMEMFNLMGETVLAEEVNSPGQEIDVSRLSMGMYFVRLTSSTEEIHVIRVSVL